MDKRFSKTALAGCREVLCSLMPGLFVPKGQVKRPMAIGVHRDILKRMGTAHPDIEVILIKQTIQHYVRGLNYQEALKFGATRFDADGLPCGSVDETAAAAAIRVVKVIRDQMKGSRRHQIEELRAVEGSDA